MTPATVCHVITRLDVGGAQHTAVTVCRLLDRQRYRPVLITGPDGGSGGSLIPEARAADIEVVVEAALVSAVRPARDVVALRRLTSAMRDIRPAIVHTHSSKAGALGRLAARQAAVPALVHTVHGWSFHDQQHPAVSLAYRKIEAGLARSTDALVVVTSEDRRLGLAAGIGSMDRYHLIRSGVALRGPVTSAERLAARARLGAAGDTKVVATVGRLEPQKDPVGLVEAVAALDRHDVTLVFVGDGALRPEVERAGRTLLPGRLSITGVVDDPRSVTAGADVFALPSRWEGLPRALVEALDAGLAVVASAVGGVGEVIEDGSTGLLVGPGDTAALAKALNRLLDDPPLAQALMAAGPPAVSGFSEQAMARDHMDLYDSLLAR